MAASACIAQRSAPRGRGSGGATTFCSESSSWQCQSFRAAHASQHSTAFSPCARRGFRRRDVL
eukprot:3578829-Pleurochrysis_carterae.AAC.1